MNLPFKGTDSGWGKEIHFGPAYHQVDGNTWILRSGKGDESLVIVVCLLEEHVDAFKKHFYDEINYSAEINMHYSFSETDEKHYIFAN